MREFFGVIELPAEVAVEALMSPDVPAGFYTVPGWWATMETAALADLEDPIAVLFDDEEQITTLAEKLGIAWTWCTAPDAFQQLGFKSTKAFPTTLMAQFYPLNP